MEKEALFYEIVKENYVKCNLCYRHCVIPNNRRGFCKARENKNGKLYAINYNKICSVAIDPIEKKPLFNYYPNSSVLSLATGGCNFSCKHCQNWQISQYPPDKILYNELYPNDIVNLANKYSCNGIAYTYTEPTIFYEIMKDTIDIINNSSDINIKNLYNVMVTNGYIEKEPLKQLGINGMNIDIKGNEKFYKDICFAHLETVLETAILAKKLGIHLEITNLIIPTYNDNIEDIKFIVEFVKNKLGKDTPLHFSAFYPTYKLTKVPPTPKETILLAKKIAEEEGLHYVYTGNIINGDENTYCPNCGEIVIKREKYNVININLIKENNIVKCGNCRTKLNIIL